MKKLLVLLLFVSSCGTMVKDKEGKCLYWINADGTRSECRQPKDNDFDRPRPGFRLHEW